MLKTKQEVLSSLEARLGPLDGKNPMAFLNKFEAQASSPRGTPFSTVLDHIINLLAEEGKVLAFSEGNIGWATKGDSLLSFDSTDDLSQALTMEVLYGAESYYVFPESLDWMAAICFDEDVHIAGSAEFIKQAKGKLGL